MAEEDEVLKRYLSDDERYADLINGVSFGGRPVVCAEDLSDRDTQTGYHKNTRTVKGKKNTKYRDLFRKASFGANFAVIGVENQKQVHYLMPVRCMEYDVKEYQRQEVEKKRELERETTLAKNQGIIQAETSNSAEFLSGFPKDGKLHPCITIVLYYGDDWNGSTDLHGLMDFTGIPEELQGMVNNYKINLLDIKKLKRTDMFHTDLKQVFDAIRCDKDKNAFKMLLEKDPAYKTIRKDAYDVITAFTKSKELMQLEESMEGETVNMYKALQDWAAEEREEGREEGIALGKIEQQLVNLRALMTNMRLSAEKAMDVLNVPLEERAQYMELM